MRIRPLLGTLACLAFILPAPLAPLLLAQEGAPEAEPLPPARSIIDAFTKETGMAKKLAETSSAHLVGKASIPAGGMEGRFERWAAKPARSLVLIDLPGFGEIRSGFDGTTGWSVDPVQGAHVMKGAELLQASSQSAYDASLRLPAAYESIETSAQKKFAGEDCWEIRYVLKPLADMAPEESLEFRTSYEYYSLATGNLIGMRTTSAMATGAMEAVVTYSKYARFGEVLQATVITQEAEGRKLVLTLESIEYDQVKDEVFELPEAVASQLRPDAPAPKPEEPPKGGGGAPR